MKKNCTGSRSSRRGRVPKPTPITIGMDLGDKHSQYCVLEQNGEVSRTGRTKHCRIAVEVGTHSRWMSRLLQELGQEGIVANARRVRLITEGSLKNDKLEARLLARLASRRTWCKGRPSW